jgi:hypothetical protein
MAQKADVVVYTISTNNSKQEKDGDKVLRYFSSETGGMAFFPFQARELAQSFREYFERTAAPVQRCCTGLEPLKADGLFHQVDVRVKTRKDLIVRARKGYYAPRG